MASPFQRYQGGIEASTGNLVPAYGQMAQMTAGAIAGFGKSIADGLQKYQENVQKDQILTQEAEMLGDQIMSFQKQFANNPEYAPFAQSLQPHIDKLAKVPTMSLSQKMGTVTGVKAAFANISPMLQAFEVNKASMLQQDMNRARAGVTEYDTVTVPTAIVAEGKMPYFYNKSYQENEAALVELAKQAQAKGAKIDIPSVVQKWREETKAGAMANNNIPPAIKEGLIKQIDSAKGLEENVQTTDGVTDYEAESAMYDASTTSVKSQLEAKAEAEKKAEVTPAQEEQNLRDTKKSLTAALEQLRTDGTASTDAGKSAIKAYEKALRETDSKLSKIDTRRNAEEKIKTIDQQIEELNARIESGQAEQLSGAQRAAVNVRSAANITPDFLKEQLAEQVARMAKAQGQEITPEWANKNIPEILVSPEGSTLAEEFARNVYKGAALGGTYMGDVLQKSPVGMLAGFFGKDITPDALKTQNLSIKESKVLADAIARTKSGLGVTRAETVEDKIKALKAQRVEQEKAIKTGIENPTQADLAKTQQTQQAQPALPEQLAVTNLGAFSMGTRTEQVQRSIEDKRRDMATYFQNKYGYIPSGFEASFKAIYPEANFKTMETPYGAFMYDGKEWKQIATQKADKAMTPKEAGEAKSYVFGQMKADGTQDFKEFLPNSGVYMRGIFSGSEKEKQDFRERMYAATRAKRTVGRLIEINDMLGESMPWNAAVQGEAKALLPEIMAALRPEIVGVGTVSNYEQEMIRDVVADPTKFFSLEASDRAKLLVIASRIDRTLSELPAVYDIEVKVAGQSNAEREKLLRTQMYSNPKSRREAEYEKTGKISWNQ